jgi:hypothetical protein
VTPHAVHARIVAAADIQVAASPDAKAIVDAGLGEQLGRLLHLVAANVSNPLAADCADELKRAAERPFSGFDSLRVAVARVDSLAAAAEAHYDETVWGPDVERQRIERQAHLCGAVREAAERALLALDALNSDLMAGEGGQW